MDVTSGCAGSSENVARQTRAASSGQVTAKESSPRVTVIGPGRTPASWEMLRADWSAARATDGETTLSLVSDLRIGIDRANGSVRLEAFVTNLWNTRGVVFYNSTGYDYFPGGSTPEIVTPPRTFGLRLHYGWGKDR